MLTILRFAVLDRGRDDLEPHDGQLRPTNQFDDVVEAPADDVDQFAALALADADDPIRRLQCAGLVRRSGGHELDDFGVVVLGAQHGPDAFQRQRHVDVEVLGRARRKILRVRVIGARVRVHVNLKCILAVRLRRLLQAILVPLRQYVLDFVELLAVQLHAEHRGLQAFAPQVVEFGGGGRPRGMLALDLDRFVRREVHVLDAVVQLGNQELESLLESRLIAIENVERGVQIAALQRVIECETILLERLNIRREKVCVTGVEQIEIFVEQLTRRRIIERLLQIVVVAQLFNDRQARPRMYVERVERLRDRERIRGRRRRRIGTRSRRVAGNHCGVGGCRQRDVRRCCEYECAEPANQAATAAAAVETSIEH